mgnify:CR=1 FL=1
MSVSGAPVFDENGVFTGYRGSGRDITQEVEAERTLRAALERAEAANRAKSEFLTNMSHELRTPLNAVIGFSDVIAQQLMGPAGNRRYVEYARDIHTSGEHLLRIISDILDLAKIEASQVNLVETAIDLGEIFAACRTLASARAEQSGITLVQASRDAGATLWADELRLKQIVLNLVTNAIKASPRGSSVTMAARVNASERYEIEIADNGCGMSDDELRLAVQPFRQVDSRVARPGEGTGLGLPLSIRLTELHGGEVKIASATGKGTTVTVVFPATRTRRLSAAA